MYICESIIRIKIDIKESSKQKQGLVTNEGA